MDIYVLNVRHKHGDNFWTFDDEEKAKDHVVKWVRDNWATGGPEHDCPKDDAEAILDYFACDLNDETWTIDHTTLNAAD